MAKQSKNNTGWKRVIPTHGNEDIAIGQAEMDKGVELSPCAVCKFFINDRTIVRKYFVEREFTDLTGEGRFFESPLTRKYIEDNRRQEAENIQSKLGAEVKDKELLKKARPRRLDVKQFGMCRTDGFPVEYQATCEKWTPSKMFQRAVDEVRKGRGPQMLNRLMKGRT